MKTCKECNIEKDIKDFHIHKTSADGLRSICKSCRSKKTKSYYKQNRQDIRARAKVYRDNNRDIVRKRNNEYAKSHKEMKYKHSKKWYMKNKEKVAIISRSSHLKTRYGLTTKEFEDLHKKQKGLCFICKKSDRLFIDHNHDTGVVRALLCNGCNAGLGMFKEDKKVLLKAIKYLEKYANK